MDPIIIIELSLVLFHVVFFKIIIIICYFSTLPFVANKDFYYGVHCADLYSRKTRAVLDLLP